MICYESPIHKYTNKKLQQETVATNLNKESLKQEVDCFKTEIANLNTRNGYLEEENQRLKSEMDLLKERNVDSKESTVHTIVSFNRNDHPSHSNLILTIINCSVSMSKYSRVSRMKFTVLVFKSKVRFSK